MWGARGFFRRQLRHRAAVSNPVSRRQERRDKDTSIASFFSASHGVFDPWIKKRDKIINAPEIHDTALSATTHHQTDICLHHDTFATDLGHAAIKLVSAIKDDMVTQDVSFVEHPV